MNIFLKLLAINEIIVKVIRTEQSMQHYIYIERSKKKIH